MKIGADDVLKIYLGSEGVSKIYLGDTMIYENNDSSGGVTFIENTELATLLNYPTSGQNFEMSTSICRKFTSIPIHVRTYDSSYNKTSDAIEHRAPLAQSVSVGMYDLNGLSDATVETCYIPIICFDQRYPDDRWEEWQAATLYSTMQGLLTALENGNISTLDDGTSISKDDVAMIVEAEFDKSRYQFTFKKVYLNSLASFSAT